MRAIFTNRPFYTRTLLTVEVALVRTFHVRTKATSTVNRHLSTEALHERQQTQIMMNQTNYNPRVNSPAALRFLSGRYPSGFTRFLSALAATSKAQYMMAPTNFCRWAMENKKEADLATLLDYVVYLHLRGYKSSTLQSMLSALKAFFQYYILEGKAMEIKRDVPDVQRLLDQWAKEEEVKKSSVFAKEEYEAFIGQNIASGDDLMLKVCMILGIHGCLRRKELWGLMFEDISFTTIDGEEALLFQLFRVKRKGRKVLTKIAVTGRQNLAVIRRYMAAFNADQRHGKFLRKVLHPNTPGGGFRISEENIGINTVGKMPYRIALALGKTSDVAKRYTGHSFRRTGATILAEAGCTLLQLKEAGGWNSSNVAESYIAASNRSKLAISRHMGFFNGVLDDESADEDGRIDLADDDSEDDGTTALVLRFRRNQM